MSTTPPPRGRRRRAPENPRRRVHEIARAHGLTGREALERLRAAGVPVTTVSSSVDPAVARRVFGGDGDIPAPAVVARARVDTIARQQSVRTQHLITRLRAAGVPVRGPATTVDLPTALRALHPERYGPEAADPPPGRARVYEIARANGVTSAHLLERLRAGGMQVRSASAAVDVERALEALRDPAVVPEPPPPAPDPAAAATDAADPAPDAAERPVEGRAPRRRRGATPGRRLVAPVLMALGVVLAAAVVTIRPWEADGTAEPRSAVGMNSLVPSPSAPAEAPPAEAPAEEPPAPVPPSPPAYAVRIEPGAVPVSRVRAARTDGLVVSYRLRAPALVVAQSTDARGMPIRRITGRRTAGTVRHRFGGGRAAPRAITISLVPAGGVGPATVIGLRVRSPTAPNDFRILFPTPGAVVRADWVAVTVEPGPRTAAAGPARYLMALDGGVPRVVEGTMATFAGLAPGDHLLSVTPLGNDGVASGPEQTVRFTTR